MTPEQFKTYACYLESLDKDITRNIIDMKMFVRIDDKAVAHGIRCLIIRMLEIMEDISSLSNGLKEIYNRYCDNIKIAKEEINKF